MALKLLSISARALDWRSKSRKQSSLLNLPSPSTPYPWVRGGTPCSPTVRKAKSAVPWISRISNGLLKSWNEDMPEQSATWSYLSLQHPGGSKPSQACRCQKKCQQHRRSFAGRGCSPRPNRLREWMRRLERAHPGSAHRHKRACDAQILPLYACESDHATIGEAVVCQRVGVLAGKR